MLLLENITFVHWNIAFCISWFQTRQSLDGWHQQLVHIQRWFTKIGKVLLLRYSHSSKPACWWIPQGRPNSLQTSWGDAPKGMCWPPSVKNNSSPSLACTYSMYRLPAGNGGAEALSIKDPTPTFSPAEPSYIDTQQVTGMVPSGNSKDNSSLSWQKPVCWLGNWNRKSKWKTLQNNTKKKTGRIGY